MGPDLRKVRELVWLGAALAVSCCWGVHSCEQRKQIDAYRNQLAESDKTVQVRDGLYKRLTVEAGDLKSLLSSKDEQLVSLREEVKSHHEQLLAVNQAVVKWKHAYEATVTGQQTEIPSVQPGGPPRERVEFKKDFGYVGVEGYTLTSPPEAHVKVDQLRPLKLSVAVVQGRDGRWSTYVSSSEENVAVDIGLSAVNPHVLERRWYERLGVSVYGGASRSAGMFGGVGAHYDADAFELGPLVWATDTGLFYGAGVTWRPFVRRK